MMSYLKQFPPSLFFSVSFLTAIFEKILVNFKAAFFETFQWEEKKQEEELDFQGNTIGVCKSHRGINYSKPSHATRRLRCGLPTTYYVSYRRE